MTIDPRRWAKYEQMRKMGYSQARAAREAGFHPSTAIRRENLSKTLNRMSVNGREIHVDNRLDVAPIPYPELSHHARYAWDDFSYFQRRYLGRIATPWQAEAAQQIVEWMASPDKEYVVINAPPGCGKSTTFSHDIPLWLTVRNRAIRGQIGSKTQSSAKRYISRIKNDLVRSSPFMPEAEDIAKGLAVPAEATIAGDYGTFKPEHKEDIWSAEGFVVVQHGKVLLDEKEPTWSAFGMDSGFLGMRYDLIIWDDLVDKDTIRTAEAREKIREWWDDIAEKRLEPAGVLVLQGQRMGAEDLYRYALDKRMSFTDEDDDEDPDADLDTPDSPRKYKHVVFKAHYDDRCRGRETHKRTSPYYPEGCLLDPRRLTWRELSQEMSNKRNNFAVIYQQEDVDPTNVLVDPMWIHGGTDPRTGEVYPGCLDKDRGLCEVPRGLYGQLVSIATADPSPTKFWAVEWWVVRVVDGQPQERYLMDLIRQKMDAPSFLDWHNNIQAFTGIMEDWQERSVDLNLPITVWIVERNGAQNFMLQYEHVRRWMAKWQTRIIPHATTAANKPNEELGVQMLANLYRYGLVRLPYRSTRGPNSAFSSTAKLVEEVTHWPEFVSDDTVMAQWFMEFNLPRIIPNGKPLPRMKRPSWLAGTNTWSWKERVNG